MLILEKFTFALAAHRAALFALCASACLAACAPSSAPAPTSPAPATAGTAPPPADAKASASDRQDISHRDDVVADVHYPAMRDELAPLDKAMHAYAEAQRAALAERLRDAAPADQRAEKPGRLSLDFTIATQTQDFVSALAEGEGEFGGAHPQPLRATFTQHLASGHIVALGDLFGDLDAALKAFSDEARRRLAPEFETRVRAEGLGDKALAERLKTLHELLDAGTAPKADNFAGFLVDGVDGKAIGITLIFPAAQVAAYVDGPQQVPVPARVFYAQLKPEYRDAFAVDKADADAASHATAAR